MQWPMSWVTRRAGIISKQAPFSPSELSIFLANELQGRIPEVTLGCMLYLRQHFPAIKVSVEVEKPARVGLTELAAQADVVFYSKSWALVSCSR